MHIITTLDECGVSDYLFLLNQINKCSDNPQQNTIVALCGDVSQTSSELIIQNGAIVDYFDSFETAHQLEKFKNYLGHPLGKIAKLLFLLEYLEKHPASDTVLFLDPDVFIQTRMSNIELFAQENVVLFGYQFENIHMPFRQNARLQVAQEYDEDTSWNATYFYELNTGVILGTKEAMVALLRRYKEFFFASDYLRNIADLTHDHWHDQDILRYFFRKTLPVDIGTFSLEHVYTTTNAAAYCLYFDVAKQNYFTAWGTKPWIIHFAGGTEPKVPWKHSWLRPTKKPVKPISKPQPTAHKTLFRKILSTSILDILQFINKKLGR